MRKIIYMLALISLLVLSACNEGSHNYDCDEGNTGEATIKVLQFRETHTKIECMDYCHNLEFCLDSFEGTYYTTLTDDACLERCA